MIGAAMGLGMVGGPGLGGWMADLSLSAPFFLAAGFSLLALLMVFLLLPESHAPGQVQPTKGKQSRLPLLLKALKSPIGVQFNVVLDQFWFDQL